MPPIAVLLLSWYRFLNERVTFSDSESIAFVCVCHTHWHHCQCHSGCQCHWQWQSSGCGTARQWHWQARRRQARRRATASGTPSQAPGWLGLTASARWQTTAVIAIKFKLELPVAPAAAWHCLPVVALGGPSLIHSLQVGSTPTTRATPGRLTVSQSWHWQCQCQCYSGWHFQAQATLARSAFKFRVTGSLRPSHTALQSQSPPS